MTLVVVVVAVVVAFFIIVVTVGWKFRQVRSGPAVTGASPQVITFIGAKLYGRRFCANATAAIAGDELLRA